MAGNQSANYVIGNGGYITYKDAKTIYPYSVSTTIKGYGDIILTNKRGLEDSSKANLIPVGSTLSVELVLPDSPEYRDIYGNISSYLSRRNVFSVGYKLVLTDKNGMKAPVSNELYLSVPHVEELTNVLSVSGERTVKVNYDKQGGNIVIDLSQISEDVSCIVLIENRALLEAWQIVLIVVLSIVGLAGVGIAVFFIVRNRRLKNERFDTI